MLNNKSAILVEFKKVMGSVYVRVNNVAINKVKFDAVEGSETAGTTIPDPGKFYVGFNLQKLNSNVLLTGISTNNSNITVNVEKSSAAPTLATRECNLVLAYDALIEIDMVNKMRSVKV